MYLYIHNNAFDSRTHTKIRVNFFTVHNAGYMDPLTMVLYCQLLKFSLSILDFSYFLPISGFHFRFLAYGPKYLILSFYSVVNCSVVQSYASCCTDFFFFFAYYCVLLSVGRFGAFLAFLLSTLSSISNSKELFLFFPR